ncbi:MAG: GAF domain-containing protein [Phototrophicaceae bacterium]
MGSFALIAIVMGLLIVGGLFWWIRQHEDARNLGVEEMIRRGSSDNRQTKNAMIVTSEQGALLHVNPITQSWLQLDGIEPTLEDIIALVKPTERFFDLLTSEGEAAFEFADRWVQATSHYMPSEDGNRMMVVMRELTHQDVSTPSAQAAGVMDVSTTIRIINEIGETVNAGMGVELALQVLLEILNKALPSDAGEICIWNDKSNFLTQRGWIGDTRYLLTIASQGGGYDKGQGIAGWMALHNQPLLIGGSGDRVNTQVIMKDVPYQSAVGVPIWIGQDFIGTLTLFSNDENHYAPETVSLLQAVNKAVGQAVRNAELYAKQEDRIRDIASLQQITEQSKGDGSSEPIYKLLNERMAKLLDADMCGVLIYDATRQALIPQMPFFGLIDSVAERIVIPLPTDSPQRDIWRNQPYWVSNDVRDEPLVETLNFGFIVDAAGIDNTALFPLQIAGERIGIMAISNKRTEGGFMPNDIQNLRVLSSQAAIVVENVRLYQRERRIDNELVGLQEMTHAIGALSHEGDFYQAISERIARLTGSTMCGVLLYNEDSRTLVSQMPFFGIDDDLVGDYHIPIPSGSVMEQLWNDEESWYSNRVESDTLVFETGLDAMAERAGVRKTLIAVMSAGGRRIGVVQVSNKSDGSDFDEKDARLLLIFATQAASIIENSRLYREVQMRANQAEGLRSVAELASSIISTEESYQPVLEQVANITNSPLVYISVVDYNSNTLVTYPRWSYGLNIQDAIIQDLTQSGYENIPARSGKYLISNNVSTDRRVPSAYARTANRFEINKFAVVPLNVGDRQIGEIAIANRDTNYNDSDIQTFSTLAAQIAPSVERLLLFEATGENLRRRVEELDAIARVSTELTLTVDLDSILAVIREEAIKATYGDGATIALFRPEVELLNFAEPELDRRVGDVINGDGFLPIEAKVLESVGTEPIIIPDYADSKIKAAPQGAQSAAAAGIIYNDEIVGVIHVYANKAGVFDSRASGFLMTLAAKASLAYQNSQLYEQQRERGERLRQRVDQLNRIFELGQMVQTNTEPVFVLEAIAYSIQQSIGFDTVLMMIVDEETGDLSRLSQAGMPLDAFNTGKDIAVSKEALADLLKEEYAQSESYFFPAQQLENWYTEAVPAVSAAYAGNRSLNPKGQSWWHDGDMLLVSIKGQGGNLLGLMSLDRPYNSKRPDRGVIEVLEIFAHQASTMIENTRLFRDSQRNAEQESKLNDTLESIAGTLDLRDITEQLTHGMRDLVTLDRITMVLVNEPDSAFDYIRAVYDEAGSIIVSQSQRSNLTDTAFGHIFDTRQPRLYLAKDLESAERFDDLRSVFSQGEKTSMYLPMISAGEILGVMHIGSNISNAYDEETQQLLIRAAQLVASTVQNARLFNQAVNLQILNRSVVESIQQGIVVLDNAGRIITVNQFMRTTYHWDDGAQGLDLFEYQPDLAELLRDDVEFVLTEGEPRERFDQSSSVDAKNSVVRNFYIYPLRAGTQIRGAVLLVEDVSERSKLEAAMDARANQLAALTEVSTRITASLEREEVIALALDEMGWIIPFDTMAVWKRTGSHMVLEGGAGLSNPNILEDGFRVLIQDYGALNAVVDSQRVIGVSEDDVPKVDIGQQSKTQSWMGVPLVNQGHVVGMLTLERDEPHAYDSRQEHNVAFAFASQVAIALANADLFEQTYERTNELGTLLEAARTTSLTRDINEVFHAVAELMFGALEMEDATIMIWNEIDNELEVQFSGNRNGDDLTLPIGTTYSVSDYLARAQSLRDREVMVIIDVDDEERLPPYPKELEEMRIANVGARMIVPLVVRDQAIGLIQLDQTSNNEESITQQKLRLARALGSQVAIAIENARLTQETTARFEELLTINQLSQSISSTLSLDAMLPIIREQVPQVTRAEELYLALYDDEAQQINFPLAVKEDGTEFHIPSRPLGDDEVSYIIKKKHALSLDDDYFSIEELRRSMKLSNGEGDIKSYMGVPLKSGDTILGVLAIRNKTIKRTFNINDDRILTTVGSQLGAAIQNARLFGQIQASATNLEKEVHQRTEQLEAQSIELEEERDRLDKLYQITSELARTLDMEQLLERSLGMVSKAVGADDGVIMLSDPATDNLYSRAWINPNHIIYLEDEDVRTHPAEGLAEWLIHYDVSGDNVVLVDDLNEEEYWDERGRATGLRSALAVMLENNEDPMGVMVLMSKRVAAFTENHLKLLVPAATQVAASINSADLYQLIRDQAERMGKLLRSEQEEAQKHGAIVESITDGVMLADANGEIIQFNNAAERILELPREQAIGQQVNKLGGMYGQAGVKLNQMMINWSEVDTAEGGNQLVSERLEFGDKIIQAQLSPVYIGDLFLGTVSVFRDITRDVEAERAKSKFIENVSHEFRTPLTPIKGYTDLLLMMGADSLDETQLSMIRTIKENTDRLAALVDDVLRVSKLDSGEDKLHMGLLDIDSVIEPIMEKHSNMPSNLDKAIVVQTTIEENLPKIRADRDKLVQVISNVVDNAFNYTRAGGSVAVNVYQRNDSHSIQIEVADTGVGIPEDFKDAAWRRFERHDPTAVELDVAGTGLGLSLARDLVYLHHGDIWFESQVGVGTTFFIRLPIEQPSYRTSTAEFPIVDETQSVAGD